jgi:hypothetical protein
MTQFIKRIFEQARKGASERRELSIKVNSQTRTMLEARAAMVERCPTNASMPHFSRILKYTDATDTAFRYLLDRYYFVPSPPNHPRGIGSEMVEALFASFPSAPPDALLTAAARYLKVICFTAPLMPRCAASPISRSQCVTASKRLSSRPCLRGPVGVRKRRSSAMQLWRRWGRTGRTVRRRRRSSHARR